MKLEIEIDEKQLVYAIASQIADKWESKINDAIKEKFDHFVKQKAHQKINDWLSSYLEKIISSEQINDKSITQIIKDNLLSSFDSKESVLQYKIRTFLDSKFSKELNMMIENTDFKGEYSDIANRIYNKTMGQLMDVAKKSLLKYDMNKYEDRDE